MCRYAAQMVGALSAGEATDLAVTRSKVKAMDSEKNYKFNVLNGMGEDIELSQRMANPSAKVLRQFLDWLDAQLDKQ